MMEDVSEIDDKLDYAWATASLGDLSNDGINLSTITSPVKNAESYIKFNILNAPNKKRIL